MWPWGGHAKGFTYILKNRCTGDSTRYRSSRAPHDRGVVSDNERALVDRESALDEQRRSIAPALCSIRTPTFQFALLLAPGGAAVFTWHAAEPTQCSDFGPSQLRCPRHMLGAARRAWQASLDETFPVGLGRIMAQKIYARPHAAASALRPRGAHTSHRAVRCEGPLRRGVQAPAAAGHGQDVASPSRRRSPGHASRRARAAPAECRSRGPSPSG